MPPPERSDTQAQSRVASFFWRLAVCYTPSCFMRESVRLQDFRPLRGGLQVSTGYSESDVVVIHGSVLVDDRTPIDHWKLFIVSA